MSQVGERYYFVSPSSEKGTDRLRTLLGAFVGSTSEGGLVRSVRRPTKEENNKLRKRIANYYSKRQVTGKRLRRSASPEGRQKILKKYANLERTRPEKEPYVFPADTIFHFSSRIWWQKETDARLEMHLLLYHPQILSEAYATREKASNYRRWSRRWTRNNKKKAAYARKQASRMWDTWSANVPKILDKTISEASLSGVVWEDFSFPFDRPIRASLVEKMNSGSSFARIASTKLHSQYGYFLENFEKLAFNQEVSETELPNVYLVNMINGLVERMQNKHSKVKGLDKDAYDSASLFKRIDPTAISFRVARNDENAIKQHRKIGKGKKRRGDVNSNSAYMNYLELWSKGYNDSPENELSEIRVKNENILFAASSYEHMQEINAKSRNVPMSTYLRFSAPTVRKDKSIIELLRKGNFMTAFMQKAIEGNMDPDQVRLTPRSLWKGSYQTQWTTDEDVLSLDEDGNVITTVEKKTTVVEDTPWLYERVAHGQGEVDSDWNTVNYYAQSYSLDKNNKVSMRTDKEPNKTDMISFNVLEFLDRLAESGAYDSLDETTEDRSIVIHSGDEIGVNTAPSSVVQLNALILAGQIRKLLEERTRSFHEILSGKPCETEVLFFEVEKTKMSKNGALEVVQRFYIPNFVGRDAIELIDSQVKYDGVYQYSIHAWTAVYGNKYKYRNWRNWHGPVPKLSKLEKLSDRSMLQFKPLQEARGVVYGVQNISSLRLMRLPYFDCSPVRVRDLPPISPHAEIVPYRGVSDKLKINLMPGVDDHHALPIPLVSSDHVQIQKYYESQYTRAGMEEYERTLEEEGARTQPVRYKSDDQPRYYEVFRITEPPRGWEDFEGGLRQVLNIDEGVTSMIDSVFPNTDYYYVFRSLDIHGNVSNPSSILKVTLHDDQGIFPVIEAYDFDKNARSSEQFKKGFRRFMQITPVFEQLVYKDERQASKQVSIANRRKIRLGTANDSIYGKKLKIRVSSKKSGKKIDLNVSFSHEHTKPPQ